MPTLQDSQIVNYNSVMKRLIVRYQIDGVWYKRRIGKVEDNQPAKDAALSLHGTKLVNCLTKEVAEEIVEDLTGNYIWVDMPEGTQAEQDLKRRVAQLTARKIVEIGNLGIRKSRRKKTRGEAAEAFYNCRKWNNKVIQQLTGNAAAKRTYLNLTPATWAPLRDFGDLLVANATAFNAFNTMMDTAVKMEVIDTEPNV